MDRHDRQARLAGVGASGQERIAAATVEVQSVDLAGEVATRYLAGAGVGCLRVRQRALAAVASSVDSAVRVAIDDARPAPTPAEEPSAGLRDPSAREVARGAREALHALRVILDERCRRIDDERCRRIDDGRCLRIDDERCRRIDEGTS